MRRALSVIGEGIPPVVTMIMRASFVHARRDYPLSALVPELDDEGDGAIRGGGGDRVPVGVGHGVSSVGVGHATKSSKGAVLSGIARRVLYSENGLVLYVPVLTQRWMRLRCAYRTGSPAS